MQQIKANYPHEVDKINLKAKNIKLILDIKFIRIIRILFQHETAATFF